MFNTLSLYTILIFTVTHPIWADTSSWPPKIDGIEIDEAVEYGVLDSGIRWAYLQNSHPEKQLSLRLIVETGSFMENESELGIAHFLEHMAFNGTEHFPAAGQAINYFKSKGISYGKQLNAETGFLHTVYKIEVPYIEDILIENAFLFLLDIAGGQVFDEEEIEKERGVILEEMRALDTSHYRAHISNLGFILGECRYMNRTPIGTEETLRSFKKADFERFYQKWYTSDRMILVGVGALSVEDFKKRISSKFSKIPLNSEPLKTPEDIIRQPLKPNVHFADTPDSESCIVQFAALGKSEKLTNPYQLYCQNLLQKLAMNFISIHFKLQVSGGDAPFIKATSNILEEEGLFKVMSLSMTTQPDLVIKCLRNTTKEIKVLCLSGFESGMEERYKQSVLANLEKQIQSVKTRQNDELIQDLVLTFLNKERVFMNPLQKYQLIKKLFDEWTGEEITKTLNNILDLDNIAILIQGNQKTLALDKDEVNAAFRSALTSESSDKQIVDELDWSYTHFGIPGKIIKNKSISPLQITQIEFANGARVNLKELHSRENEIGIIVRIGNGLSGIENQDRALSIAIPIHLQLGGLGKHSLEDIQRVSLGKQITTSQIKIGDFAIKMGGKGTKSDFPRLLEIIMAYITDPGFRSSSDSFFQKHMQSTWKDEPTKPWEVYDFRVKHFLYSENWRFSHPNRNQILAQTIEESKEWLIPQLKNGYIEIGIVGDFQTEEMQELLIRTVGALPPRETDAPLGTAEESPKITGENRQVFTYKGSDQKSAITICIPTCSGIEWEKAVIFGIISDILSSELQQRIREDLGGFYGISCGSLSDWNFPGFGRIIAYMECDPERIDELQIEIEKVISKLSAEGCTEDMFKQALEPKINSLKTSMEDPDYWLKRVLSKSQGAPWVNQRMLGELDVLKSLSLETVNQFLRKYFLVEKTVIVQIRPDQEST